jgi:peptide/nickel transport system substrate-binding protein
MGVSSKISKVMLCASVFGAMTMMLSPVASAQSTTISIAGGWQTNGITNPLPQANGNIIDTGLSYAPLAWYKYTGNYNFWPVLAKSWNIATDGNTVTVTLNPKAKWSDGSQITANDVYTTFEMQFIDGNAESWGLTGMKIINSSTIVFYKDPHFLYNKSMLLQQILNNNIILPAKNYAPLLPKASLIFKTVHLINGNSKAKATISANNLLTQ